MKLSSLMKRSTTEDTEDTQEKPLTVWTSVSSVSAVVERLAFESVSIANVSRAASFATPLDAPRRTPATDGQSRR